MAGRRYGSCVLKDVLMDVACGAAGSGQRFWSGGSGRRRWSADDKLQIAREAFAPGARVALVARRRDVSRSQIYQWRAALREGRLGGSGGEVVGFVPVEMPLAPSTELNATLPGTGSFTAEAVIEVGDAGGQRYGSRPRAAVPGQRGPRPMPRAENRDSRSNVLVTECCSVHCQCRDRWPECVRRATLRQ
jgi:transposase-like protein